MAENTGGHALGVGEMIAVVWPDQPKYKGGVLCSMSFRAETLCNTEGLRGMDYRAACKFWRTAKIPQSSIASFAKPKHPSSQGNSFPPTLYGRKRLLLFWKDVKDVFCPMREKVSVLSCMGKV